MVERSSIPVFRQDPILVLILGFITCGLYLIYWNIKTAQVLNAVAEREAVSPVVAVIAGCCYPVNGFFYYQCGECLSDVGKLIGRDLSGKTVLLVVLGIFIPMLAAMIVQSHVNEIYDVKK